MLPGSARSHLRASRACRTLCHGISIHMLDIDSYVSKTTRWRSTGDPGHAPARRSRARLQRAASGRSSPALTASPRARRLGPRCPIVPTSTRGSRVHDRPPVHPSTRHAGTVPAAATAAGCVPPSPRTTTPRTPPTRWCSTRGTHRDLRGPRRRAQRRRVRRLRAALQPPPRDAHPRRDRSARVGHRVDTPGPRHVRHQAGARPVARGAWRP